MKKKREQGRPNMKNTDNLQQELMEAPTLDQFLSENQDNFTRESVCELLEKLMKKRKMSKAVLARLSGMSEVYLHQVFSGRRNPSRSRLLCLCFGLGTTLEESQELLKQCGYARLCLRAGRSIYAVYSSSKVRTSLYFSLKMSYTAFSRSSSWTDR